jgi:hypothetical protein
MNERLLYLSRQRHRESIHINLVDVEAFGFQVQLMSLTLREPHDLVFERRAVPRADAVNLPVVKRTPVDVLANEIAHTIVRVQQPAACTI